MATVLTPASSSSSCMPVVLVRLAPEMVRSASELGVGAEVGHVRFESGEMQVVREWAGSEGRWTASGGEHGRVECYREGAEVGPVVGRYLVRPEELGEEARSSMRTRTDRAKEQAKERKTVRVDEIRNIPKRKEVRKVVPVVDKPKPAIADKTETLVVVPSSLDATLEDVKGWFDGLEPSRVGVFRAPPPKTSRDVAAWQRRRRPDAEVFDSAYAVFRSSAVAAAAINRAGRGAIATDAWAYVNALGIDVADGPLRKVLDAIVVPPLATTTTLDRVLGSVRVAPTFRAAAGLDVDRAVATLREWKIHEDHLERAHLALQIDPNSQQFALAFLANLRAALAAELDLLINVLVDALPPDALRNLGGLMRRAGPDDRDPVDFLPAYVAAAHP